MKTFILWLIATVIYLIGGGYLLSKLQEASDGLIIFAGFVYCAIGLVFLIKTLTALTKYKDDIRS